MTIDRFFWGNRAKDWGMIWSLINLLKYEDPPYLKACKIIQRREKNERGNLPSGVLKMSNTIENALLGRHYIIETCPPKKNKWRAAKEVVATKYAVCNISCARNSKCKACLVFDFECLRAYFFLSWIRRTKKVQRNLVGLKQGHARMDRY